MTRARIARLGRGEGGYTMIELLSVLTIFLVITTALTTLFISGAKAEMDANERFQAQQSARLALDRLRRELHCSNGITNTDGTPLAAVAVSAISVSLLSHCPSSGGANVVVDYQMVAKGPSRYELQRVAGGVAIPLADYFTENEVFTFTIQSDDSRAFLHVDLPVDLTPNEGSRSWRLVDDIVLRNTIRKDPETGP